MQSQNLRRVLWKFQKFASDSNASDMGKCASLLYLELTFSLFLEKKNWLENASLK